MTALGEAANALTQDSDGIESPSYLYWMDAGEHVPEVAELLAS
ncbi:hypothetical protein [Streptomyces sp. NPDC050738]